jgi:hypothetical protein
MGISALVRLLIREIAAAGKGLLWRDFLLSRALGTLHAGRAFAHGGWIGFNTFQSQSKEFDR